MSRRFSKCQRRFSKCRRLFNNVSVDSAYKIRNGDWKRPRLRNTSAFRFSVYSK